MQPSVHYLQQKNRNSLLSFILMITGIILASGLSRRMGGRDKLLLPVNGAPLVEHVMRAADLSELDEIVLAYKNPAIAGLAKKYRIRALHNKLAALGQSESIKAGVRAASPDAEAYLFMTGDQPGLTAAAVNLLIAAWRDHPGMIIVASYGGRRGNPTIFPTSLRDRLLSLEGDSGGKAVMEVVSEKIHCVDMPDRDAGIDIDTPEDYASVQRL